MILVVLLAAELVTVPMLAFERGQDQLRHVMGLSRGVSVGDAWAFLGILAALVVAMQIAVWSDRQSDDAITRVRYRRFVGAAVLTGAAAIISWLIFLKSFGANHPGEFLIVTLAVVGIVLFAADGASLVLRVDRRAELRSGAREGIRRIESSLRQEYLNLRRPALVLVGCVVACGTWAILISVATLSAFYIGALWAGEHAARQNWGPLIADVIAISISFFAWGVFAVALIWAARRTESPWVRVITRIAVAILLLLPLAATLSMVGSGIASDQPAWVIVLTGIYVLVPCGLPMLALTMRTRASRKSSWWHPRSALRLGGAAVARLLVQSQLKSAASSMLSLATGAQEGLLGWPPNTVRIFSLQRDDFGT
jgi:hypothetical protein